MPITSFSELNEHIWPNRNKPVHTSTYYIFSSFSCIALHSNYGFWAPIIIPLLFGSIINLRHTEGLWTSD
jgi:hypothetical protein